MTIIDNIDIKYAFTKINRVLQERLNPDLIALRIQAYKDKIMSNIDQQKNDPKNKTADHTGWQWGEERPNKISRK